MSPIDCASGQSSPVSLKRADWRFLLPAPAGGCFRRLVLLGGPAGLATRLIATGLAQHVSDNPADCRSADALAVLYDAADDPLLLLDKLRPGCAVYCEVDRRRTGQRTMTPARLVRRLRGAGLTPTGLYWAKPHFDACEMFLPLEARWALNWYATTLYVPTTATRRLLAPWLALLGQLGSPALAPLAPCYALTAIAPPLAPARAPVSPARIPVAADRRHPVRPLLVTSADDERSRVVVLPFPARGKRPAIVIKAARRTSLDAHTEHEQEALRAIRALLDSRLQATLPQPLGMLAHDGFQLAVEQAAPGRCLSAINALWGGHARPKLAGLQRVLAWLTAFHEQTCLECVAWDRLQIARWIEVPLQRYRQTFGYHPEEDRLFITAHARATMLAGASLPIVWQHHDLHEANIYLTGDGSAGGIMVIDWERARPGMPLVDLLYFLIFWSFTVRGLRGDAAQLRGFRDLFLAPAQHDRWVGAAHATIGTYLARLGIARDFLPLLLTVSCVEHALDWAERQQEIGRGMAPHADRRQGNRWATYVTMLATEAASLYATTTGKVAR